MHTIVARHAEGALTPLDRLRQKLITQIGNAVFLTRPEAPDAIRELKRFVVDLCLSGLSPVARDDFLRSLCTPKPEDAYEKDRARLEKFMGLAALLTRPEDMQGILAGPATDQFSRCTSWRE